MLPGPCRSLLGHEWKTGFPQPHFLWETVRGFPFPMTSTPVFSVSWGFPWSALSQVSTSSYRQMHTFHSRDNFQCCGSNRLSSTRGSDVYSKSALSHCALFCKGPWAWEMYKSTTRCSISISFHHSEIIFQESETSRQPALKDTQLNRH